MRQGVERKVWRNSTRGAMWLALASVASMAELLALLWFRMLPEPAARPLRAAILLVKDPIEQGFREPDFKANSPISGIIVLGGQQSRFHATARLALRFPGARIVASGASAEELAVLAAEGVPHSRVLVDAEATTTFVNGGVKAGHRGGVTLGQLM